MTKLIYWTLQHVKHKCLGIKLSIFIGFGQDPLKFDNGKLLANPRLNYILSFSCLPLAWQISIPAFVVEIWVFIRFIFRCYDGMLYLIQFTYWLYTDWESTNRQMLKMCKTCSKQINVLYLRTYFVTSPIKNCILYCFIVSLKNVFTTMVLTFSSNLQRKLLLQMAFNGNYLMTLSHSDRSKTIPKCNKLTTFSKLRQ